MKRSERKFKWFLCVSLVLSIVISACQTTPDKEAVQGKNENAILQPRPTESDKDIELSDVTNDIDSSQPPESVDISVKDRIQAPSEWKMKKTERAFHLSIDAPVIVPDVNDIPVYRITKGEFSQDIVDTIWDHFIGDAMMWERSKTLSRSDIEELLLMYKETLRVTPDEDGRRLVQSQIDFLEKQYLSTPEDNEKIQCNSAIKQTYYHFGDAFSTQIDRYYGFAAENETKSMHVMNPWIGNDATIAERSQQSILSFAKGEEVEDIYAPVDYKEVSIDEIQKKLLLTEADAQREIIDLFAKMNVSVIIEKSTVVQNEIINSKFEKIGMGDKFAYRFNILRVTDENIPISQMKRDFPTSYSVDESSGFVEYSLPWDNERIVVTMNDNGVFSFSWIAPIEIHEILNEKSDLLPYKEIQEIFTKAIERQYLPRSGNYKILECRVSEVRLEMGRIRKQDSMTECLIVPVWNFYGSSAASNTEETLSDIQFERDYPAIVLSINAIDGSVINLRDGY